MDTSIPITIMGLFRSHDIPDEITCKIIYEYGGMVHPVAKIVRKGLIDSKEYYRFIHVYSDEVKYNVSEANTYNPRKAPVDWGEGHTYFFHRDYDKVQSYEERKDNPEYIYSRWRLFVYDGSTKYWNGSTHNYPKELMSNRELVPVACMGPDDETPTDRDRRYTEYRKSRCSWAIKQPNGCNCSETGGICLKRENELYRAGYYDDEFVNEPGDSDSDNY